MLIYKGVKANQIKIMKFKDYNNKFKTNNFKFNKNKKLFKN